MRELFLYIDFIFVFFFKQKTAYEMSVSDWSSDVCSSDLESIRNSLITNRTAPAIIICWPRVLQSTKARASLLLRMISRTIPDLMARATTSAHTSGILKVFNFALQ